MRTINPVSNPSFLFNPKLNIVFVYVSVASTRFGVLKEFLTKASQLSLLTNLQELNSKLDHETFAENLSETFHYLRKLTFYESKYSKMNERLYSLQTNLQTSAEYESMLEVLKQLNYISDTNILHLKGQVAALFGSGKELLLTELIYQNLIDALSPSEIAALLSAIVFQGKRFDTDAEKENEKPEITPALQQAKQRLSKLFALSPKLKRKKHILISS